MKFNEDAPTFRYFRNLKPAGGFSARGHRSGLKSGPPSGGRCLSSSRSMASAQRQRTRPVRDDHQETAGDG